MIRLASYFVISIPILFLLLYPNNSNADNTDLPKFSNVQTETGIPFIGQIGQVATGANDKPVDDVIIESITIEKA